MVKEIPLTQGKFALVDDEDYDWLNQWKWQAVKGTVKQRKVFYATRQAWSPSKKTVIMHRLIMNAPPGRMVDHINGDGLDNQKINLRLVTRRQNMQNRHHKKTSKYPGVCWKKHCKLWVAKIQICKKSFHLGYFKSEKDAFEAYKEAVQDLAGEKLVCELNKEGI